MLKMKDLREFVIPFVGLKEGKHEFDYHLDNTFFNLFDYDEFHSANLNVKLVLVKKPTMFELEFHIDGTVNVDCDRSGEAFDLPISARYPLIIKFGDTMEELDEELLIIPHSSYQLELAHYIYEYSVLSVPLKRVNPLLEEDLEELDEQQSTDSNESKKAEGHDPRWDKLNELITGKKA